VAIEEVESLRVKHNFALLVEEIGARSRYMAARSIPANETLHLELLTAQGFKDKRRSVLTALSECNVTKLALLAHKVAHSHEVEIRWNKHQNT
jgi:hypothetical protein